jgi:hypothetical protein
MAKELVFNQWYFKFYQVDRYSSRILRNQGKWCITLPITMQLLNYMEFGNLQVNEES